MDVVPIRLTGNGMDGDNDVDRAPRASHDGFLLTLAGLSLGNRVGTASREGRGVLFISVVDVVVAAVHVVFLPFYVEYKYYTIFSAFFQI